MASVQEIDALLPSTEDILALVPGPIQKELRALEGKREDLITKEEILNARIAAIREKITTFALTSKIFCKQFLGFLQQQNEELRTIALAANGSYTEAIPKEKKTYATLFRQNNAWSPNYNWENNAVAAFVLPSPAVGAATQVADHIRESVVGYIHEFAAKIVHKGRLAQVEAFLNKIPVPTLTAWEIARRNTPGRSTCFGGPDNFHMNWLLTENPKFQTRMEFFVHMFRTNELYRNRALGGVKKEFKNAPDAANKDPEAAAKYIWTTLYKDQQRDEVGREFDEWRKASPDREPPTTQKDTDSGEPSLEGLSGEALRGAISAGIKFHTDRIAWLSTQFARA